MKRNMRMEHQQRRTKRHTQIQTYMTQYTRTQLHINTNKDTNYIH